MSGGALSASSGVPDIGQRARARTWRGVQSSMLVGAFFKLLFKIVRSCPGWELQIIIKDLGDEGVCSLKKLSDSSNPRSCERCSRARHSHQFALHSNCGMLVVWVQKLVRVPAPEDLPPVVQTQAVESPAGCSSIPGLTSIDQFASRHRGGFLGVRVGQPEKISALSHLKKGFAIDDGKRCSAWKYYRKGRVGGWGGAKLMTESDEYRFELLAGR